jgi:TPR repeat protein
MDGIKSVLQVLAFTAFLTVSASAQSLSSGPVPEKLNGQLAALSRKALAGDIKAQLRMGLAFEFGDGVDKNVVEAMRWYRLAADRGDPVAQTDLGYLCETGANGQKNPAEAAKWYTRAAVSGFARAKFNLGVLYLQGAGVEKSEEEAAHWIGEAADDGCPSAMVALSYLYANGGGVSPDPQKALELRRKADKKDDPNLCMRLSSRTVAQR